MMTLEEWAEYIKERCWHIAQCEEDSDFLRMGELEVVLEEFRNDILGEERFNAYFYAKERE